MKLIRILLLAGIAGLGGGAVAVHAAEEDLFLEQFRPQPEQTVGQGQTVLWTLPLVATQYQPAHPTPAMLDALRAQNEGRFLDALIPLDEASRGAQAGAEARAEMDLLRASFLLQGRQSGQALEILAPLSAGAQHAADAHALAAMAYLQQGRVQQAVAAAQQARQAGDGMLSALALSYALQGSGHLAEAQKEIGAFNARAPQAITVAREAELALTLDQVGAARTLVNRAEGMDAAQPYVVAVSGLVYLIDGQADAAKAAFGTALRRDPRDARALLGMGLAEIRLGDFDAGQKELQAANEADPGNALILTYLGRSQQQAGQTDAALASWRSAAQADPKDPIPWLYRAQAQLQANRLDEARASLDEARSRLAYRSVYRGAALLHEDEQLLQANLAEIERRQGLDELAFHTLADPVGAKSASNLKDQAALLQGRPFGESARRSLLLQSLFDDAPGALPPELDIYGDGAGQTGATVPQHGVVSGLNAQQASYNNYDSLFNRQIKFTADATGGSQNSSGGQVRLGAGDGAFGLGVAARQYRTDGYAPFTNLDNRIAQVVAQWRPGNATQAFASWQTFNSQHGETDQPADPANWGKYYQIADDSSIVRLGLRHDFGGGELRGLLSRQQTGQVAQWEFMNNTPQFSTLPPFFGPVLPFPQKTEHNTSLARGAELQYRTGGERDETLWGLQATRAQVVPWWGGWYTNVAQQLYAARRQALGPHWQLDAQLGWGKMENLDSAQGNVLLRRWLPRLGLLYTPDAATHLRFAAWQGLDDFALGNATLAPATLAGIVLSRPGDQGKLVHGIALGGDRQLGRAWQLDGRAQRRWTDNPLSDQTYFDKQKLDRQQIDEAGLALHWQPEHRSVVVTAAYDYEHFWDDPTFLTLDSLQQQTLHAERLGLRWMAGASWTFNVNWSHNRVAAKQFSSDANLNQILLDVNDRFNQLDASLDWQFERSGSLSLGVRNATDRNFRYTNLDPLNPRYSQARLAYARLKLAW